MKKRIVKVITSTIIIMLIPLIFSGCFNYNDINKVTFSTTSPAFKLMTNLMNSCINTPICE